MRMNPKLKGEIEGLTIMAYSNEFYKVDAFYRFQSIELENAYTA